MDPSQLVDWIRDCVVVAEIATRSGDDALYHDAVDELRELFAEYQRRIRLN